MIIFLISTFDELASFEAGRASGWESVNRRDYGPKLWLRDQFPKEHVLENQRERGQE